MPFVYFSKFKKNDLWYKERTQTLKVNFGLSFQTSYYPALRQGEFFVECDYVPAKGMFPGGNAIAPTA